MTRVDPSLLVALANALQTPVRTGEATRRRTTAARAGAGRRPAGSPPEQLLALVHQRIRQLGRPEPLTQDELLTVAIQETLALEFGEEIALHPRFTEIVGKIHATLGSMPEFRAVLPLLEERAGDRR